MKIVRIKIQRVSPQSQQKGKIIARAKLFFSDGSQIKNIKIGKDKNGNFYLKFPEEVNHKDPFAFHINQLSSVDRSNITNLIIQATWQMTKNKDVNKLDLILKDLIDEAPYHLENLFITAYQCIINEKNDITPVVEEYYLDIEELDDLQCRLSMEGYSKQEIENILEFVVRQGGVQRANQFLNEALLSLS